MASTIAFFIHIRDLMPRDAAGFVIDRLGWLPRVGDRVEMAGHVLTVTAMDRLRIALPWLEAMATAPHGTPIKAVRASTSRTAKTPSAPASTSPKPSRSIP
jgi:hypothetical protein